MKRKFGSFLLLLSMLTLLLFFASDFSDNTDFRIFFGGLFMLLLAISLLRNQRDPNKEASRFRTVRKLGKRKTKKE